jgi:hypothetical protein
MILVGKLSQNRGNIMSDPTRHTPQSAERNLSSRFGYYLFAIVIFYGAHFIYKAEGTAFDVLAGIMTSTLVSTLMQTVRQSLSTEQIIMKQLASYKASGYRLRSLLKIGDIWYWLVPVFVVPYLLYKNDFPIQLLKFGISFAVAFIGVYLVQMKRSLAFYKKMDKHINWESIYSTSRVKK